MILIKKEREVLRDNQRSREKGIALVMSLMIIVFLLILAFALLVRIPSEYKGTAHQTRANTALYVAEAGLQHALAELRSNPDPGIVLTPGSTPVASLSSGNKLWISSTPGLFTLTPTSNPLYPSAGAGITPTPVGNFWALLEEESVNPRRVKVLAWGQESLTNIGKKIEAVAETSSPGEYFAASAETIAVVSGSVIHGKVYAKDLVIYVDRDKPPVDPTPAAPGHNIWFEQAPRYSRDLKIYNDNPTPTPSLIGFTGGPPVLGPAITLPRLDSVNYNEWGDPSKGGLTYDGNAYLKFETDSITGVTTIQEYSDSTYATLTGTSSLPTSGVIYVKGDAYLHGTLSGKVTLVAQNKITSPASGDIYIVGDLNYYNTGSYEDGLGLFSQRDVIIDQSAISYFTGDFDHDGDSEKITLNFLVIAQDGTLKASGSSYRNLYLNGTVVSRGTVKLSAGIKGTRTYTYDPRYALSPLPHMPYIADVISWREISFDNP